MPHLQIFLPDAEALVHEFAEEKTTIGRVEGNTLQIDDPSVSSQHAEILSDGELFHLHDLGSTNGTYLNGGQVIEAVLNHGDELRFGSIQALFIGKEDADAQPLPQTSSLASAAAAQSKRPDNFVCTSPIPRNVRRKDPVALVAMVLGILGLVACAVAAAMALTMSA